MKLQHIQATIRTHPRTQHWQAVFYAYDASAGRWLRRMKSTKTTSKVKAAAIAHELQQFAIRAAGQGSDSAITRDYVISTLNHILRLAGHEEVHETSPWDRYAQQWIDLQRTRITPSSLASAQSAVDKFNDWLGSKKSMPINQITGQLVQRWYAEAMADGMRPSSANVYLGTLKRILKRAHAEGMCDRNPADFVTKEHNQESVREPFTSEEIAQILQHLRHTEQAELLTLTLFGICTAQRLTDCANASWAQITQTQDGTFIWSLKQEKTKAKLNIPIVEPLASHLTQVPESQRQGHLMPTMARIARQGSKLSVMFIQALQDAGIELNICTAEGKSRKITNKSFHSLRHTTNSLLANAGIPIDIRRKITGHASDRMNAHYTHLDMKTTLAALQQGLGELSKR